MAFHFELQCSLPWPISNSNKHTVFFRLFPHVTKCSLTFIFIYSVHSCCVLCFWCFNSLNITFKLQPQYFSHLDKEMLVIFFISNSSCFCFSIFIPNYMSRVIFKLFSPSFLKWVNKFLSLKFFLTMYVLNKLEGGG